MAISLPRMPRSSLKAPASCDGAIISHLRYPAGILTPKIGDASFPATLVAVGTTAIAQPAATINPAMSGRRRLRATPSRPSGKPARSNTVSNTVVHQPGEKRGVDHEIA